MAAKLIRIHAQCDKRQRRDLLKIKVGLYVLLDSLVYLGDIRDLSGAFKLVEYREQYALLAIHARDIGRTVALPGIIQYRLPVQMLHAGMQRTPVHGDFDIDVIIYAAHCVHDLLDHIHVEANIMIDFYHAANRFSTVPMAYP